MGSLRSDTSGLVVVLEAFHTIGRSERALLRLAGLHVSIEHAYIRWEGESWSIRDLGSVNRTFLDGQALSPGQSHELRDGAMLGFGRADDLWRFESSAPPVVMAVPLDSGAPVVEDGGLLPLPSHDDPVVTLCRNSDGAWEVEQAGAAPKVLADQAVIEVLGARFKVCIPRVVARTTPVEALRGACVADLSVHFHVSEDLDEVGLVVRRGAAEERLSPRSHFEFLRVLARARRRDLTAGLPDPSCGWLHVEDLCRQVKLDLEHIHVQIYRVRRQFSALGLIDPAGVIERRPGSRMLRFGVGASSEGTA